MAKSRHVFQHPPDIDHRLAFQMSQNAVEMPCEVQRMSTFAAGDDLVKQQRIG